ncbi:MAG: helix-turn-helix domain-containing protein [Bacteroidales bacterium]|nr:helix-turn-helix domain-containing protein [Candidatus Scybalousia scybalohippi]
MEQKLCYTAKELCELTGLNKNNLALYRDMDLLKAIQVGNKYLYPHTEVEKFLEKVTGMNIASKYTIIATKK